jgi:hypothetical protein
MSTRFTKLRKIAQQETVGNRAHLYEHINPRIRRYNLGPLIQDIPFKTYTFVLHEECTRKVYLQLKALKKVELREARSPTRPKRRYIVGFASLMRIRRPKEWESRTSPIPS